MKQQFTILGTDEANTEHFHEQIMKVIKENNGMFGNLRFWSSGMKQVGQYWASNWSFGEGKPEKRKLDEDHFSVRQVGTRKVVSSEGKAYNCVLTNMEVKFAHGQHTEVVETWKEEKSIRGLDMGGKPKEFHETHYLPRTPEMKMEVSDKRDVVEHATGKKVGTISIPQPQKDDWNE